MAADPFKCTLSEGEVLYALAYVELPDGTLMVDAHVTDTDTNSTKLGRHLYNKEDYSSDLLDDTDDDATDAVEALATTYNWPDSVGFNFSTTVAPGDLTTAMEGGGTYIYEVVITLSDKAASLPTGIVVSSKIYLSWEITVKSRVST